MTPLTTPETARAQRLLDDTFTLMAGAVRGLNPGQFHFRPSSGAWSIAEILEHCVLSQGFLLGPIRAGLAQAPSSEAARCPDAILIAGMLDRGMRFKAPPFMLPTGERTPEQSLAELQNSLHQLGELLESTPDLRQHSLPAPPVQAFTRGEFQELDGYQWVLAGATHIERHIKQILEVKSAPGFPSY